MGGNIATVQDHRSHLSELHDVLNNVDFFEVLVAALGHDPLSLRHFEAAAVANLREHELEEVSQGRGTPDQLNVILVFAFVHRYWGFGVVSFSGARCAQRLLCRCLVLAGRLSVFLDSEELGDDHVVEGAKVYDPQQRNAYEEKAFSEAANVPDPVQDVVYLPIDDVQIELYLEGHRDVDLVVKLIGPRLLLDKFEDACRDLLCEGVEMDAAILQVQIRHLQLEDDLFAQLTVDRNPVRAGLFYNFSLREFLDNETTLVSICEDELPPQPSENLFIALARSVATLLVALLKFNHDRAGHCRVVVTLHPHELRVDALKLLVVVGEVIHGVLVQGVEEARLLLACFLVWQSKLCARARGTWYFREFDSRSI